MRSSFSGTTIGAGSTGARIIGSVSTAGSAAFDSCVEEVCRAQPAAPHAIHTANAAAAKLEPRDTRVDGRVRMPLRLHETPRVWSPDSRLNPRMALFSYGRFA